jgi:hypothetical protein
MAGVVLVLNTEIRTLLDLIDVSDNPLTIVPENIKKSIVLRLHRTPLDS